MHASRKRFKFVLSHSGYPFVIILDERNLNVNRNVAIPFEYKIRYCNQSSQPEMLFTFDYCSK